MMNDKVRRAMNEQIKHDLESYYIYLSMAAYFHSESLDGMGHWMRCQAHEETIHGMKFFDHIMDRGEKVELVDLKQTKTEWKSPLEAWQDTCEHEQFISGKISDLMKIARQEGDVAAEPMLSWFVSEQIEEESSADKIRSQVEMVGDSKDGLLMLDRELAARPFPPGSPFDPAAYNQAG
jgi:ferritin